MKVLDFSNVDKKLIREGKLKSNNRRRSRGYKKKNERIGKMFYQEKIWNRLILLGFLQILIKKELHNIRRRRRKEQK